VDLCIEDYNLLVAGNKKLTSERNELKHRCTDLHAALVEVHSDAQKRIDGLEARVKSAEACIINAATNGEKRLKEFENGLVQKFGELHRLYTGNVQTIGGLCSPMLAEEPSGEDYLRWLSGGVFGLPSVFSGVNENFSSAAIEGALAMARDSIDLDTGRSAAAQGGMDVLPTGPDVRKAVWAVLTKLWRSFGYDYVLSLICAKREEILAYFQLLLWFGDSYSVTIFVGYTNGKGGFLRVHQSRLFLAPTWKKRLILRS
jgi:hypothetical protein